MMKNNWEKEAGKGLNLKIVLSVVHQLKTVTHEQNETQHNGCRQNKITRHNNKVMF